MSDEQWPRRACIDKYTPAETAIRAAVLAVEEAGADLRLTDAVVLLQRAKDRVADFVDGVKPGHDLDERAAIFEAWVDALIPFNENGLDRIPVRDVEERAIAFRRRCSPGAATDRAAAQQPHGPLTSGNNQEAPSPQHEAVVSAVRRVAPSGPGFGASLQSPTNKRGGTKLRHPEGMNREQLIAEVYRLGQQLQREQRRKGTKKKAKR